MELTDAALSWRNKLHEEADWQRGLKSSGVLGDLTPVVKLQVAEARNLSNLLDKLVVEIERLEKRETELLSECTNHIERYRFLQDAMEEQ
jgi:hypothetical protein